MSEHKQIIESLLAELKAALTEPYASDRAKVIDIENVARRYRFFMETPARLKLPGGSWIEPGGGRCDLGTGCWRRCGIKTNQPANV